MAVSAVYKVFIFSLLGLAISSQVQADKILLTQFDYNGYTEMRNALIADGHTVDIVDVRTGGTLATTLSSMNYDQVFLYDITSNLYLSAADVAALGVFWSNSGRGLVVDTRSYGFTNAIGEPNQYTLLRNVASNLQLSGGGVWVGTDHDPTWTRNANPFLAEIGVDPVTGIFSDPVNYADPSSVLLSGVTPTQLWGGGQSVGQAPIGIQPNGIEMFIHFGHIRQDNSILPYISASFPLSGPPPRPVPEPTTIALFGFGLIGLGLGARRRNRPH